MKKIHTNYEGRRITVIATSYPAALDLLNNYIGELRRVKTNQNDNAITRGSRDADGASEATAAK